MILNIIDRRSNPNHWRIADVVVEPTWHDNRCPSADQAERDDRVPGYAAGKGVSVADAIAWASSIDVEVTLYLYDPGNVTRSFDWRVAGWVGD